MNASLILDLDRFANLVAERVAQRLQAQSSGSTAMLTRAEVAQRIGKSTTTAKRLQADPSFPKPVRIGNSRPRWRAAEVDQWLDRHGGGR